jgi:hypothetical protein
LLHCLQHVTEPLVLDDFSLAKLTGLFELGVV